MKNGIVFLLAAFALTGLHAQRHFRTELRIRVNNDTIVADLVALEDYGIAALQFGFYHNSEDVYFEKISSNKLAPIQLAYWEICPRHVRISWNTSTTTNIGIRAGDTILSLHYTEQKPTSHFICMMSSTGSGCQSFFREVVDENLNPYIVDDVCVFYRVVGGVVELISSTNDAAEDNPLTVWSHNNYLYISRSAGYRGPLPLRIYNLEGQSVFQGVLDSDYQHFSLPHLSSGVYLLAAGNSGKLRKFYID